MKPETEEYILVARDQCVLVYQTHIERNGVDPKCRFCTHAEEIIDHLIYGCYKVAPRKFKNRVD